MKTEAKNEEHGAVDLHACPWPANKCKCGICKRCGFQKHTAVHGPALGEPAGSAPYDHEFVS